HSTDVEHLLSDDACPCCRQRSRFSVQCQRSAVGDAVLALLCQHEFTCHHVAGPLLDGSLALLPAQVVVCPCSAEVHASGNAFAKSRALSVTAAAGVAATVSVDAPGIILSVEAVCGDEGGLDVTLLAPGQGASVVAEGALEGVRLQEGASTRLTRRSG